MLKYNHIEFPDPLLGSKEGLIAQGGDLSSDMLISAYMQGMFPWFNKEDPILWWCPDPRMILYPAELNVSKSLLQTLRRNNFRVSFDTNFDSVINACAEIPRQGQEETWITEGIIESYNNLHQMGIAHSVEVYHDNELAGGLYGISLGKAFFGESMFHYKRDASKVALYYLCEFLKERKFHFIDVQQSTSHLLSLGAIDIPRAKFIEKLRHATTYPTLLKKWVF